MRKVLVAPSSFGECGMEPLELLRAGGFKVIVNPYGRKLTETELISLAPDMVGTVAGVESYSQRVLDQLPALKCISRVGVGVDSIDIAYAKETGIEVLITPEGPTQAVAELSVGLAFDILRRISLSDHRIRSGIWKKEIGNLLAGKTVAIIGLGRIGKRTAGLYKALGCNIIACDKHPDLDWMKANSVIPVPAERAFAECDILSIHVPGPENGVALIQAAELNLMKPGVVIINLSRGGVIDEGDLLAYLQQNPDSFAALDVFETEPYKGPFTGLDNIVLTPHLGSYAREAKLGMEIDAVNNLINFFKKHG